MTLRTWIVAGVVLIGVAAGVGLLVQASRHAPLHRASERTCIGCVTTFWNGTATIRANRMSAAYVFAKDASYLVSFEDGTVVLAGERLTPGCHEGRAAEGTRLEFDDARRLRLRVPAPDEGCPAPAES
jgi:hypothetical protein